MLEDDGAKVDVKYLRPFGGAQVRANDINGLGRRPGRDAASSLQQIQHRFLSLVRHSSLRADDLSVKKQSAELERRLISRALQMTDGNRTKAAELLDLSYRALLYKIRDYGLD